MATDENTIKEDSGLPDPAVAPQGMKESDSEDTKSSPSPSTGKTKKKRDASTLRKAPQAPKRFKSSYICFFMAKQQEIKDELGQAATVTEVSKRSAEMWRNLPAEERAYWDDAATKDKQRYMAEKASYTGPWQVPWKRAKKDPSAPKRPMSAFLYFSQEKRRIIKDKNPGMRNTEVSRVLGEMWRNAPEEERNPHIEREARERKKYKVAIAQWREEHDAKIEAQKKAAEEQRLAAAQQMYAPVENVVSYQHNMAYADPNMGQSAGVQNMSPYNYSPAPYGYSTQQPYVHPQQGQQGGYSTSMMYPPYYQGHQGTQPSNQQMMVLGPNGAPQQQQMPQQYSNYNHTNNYSQPNYPPSNTYQQQQPQMMDNYPPSQHEASYHDTLPPNQNDDYEPQDPNMPMSPYHGGYGYSFDMDHQNCAPMSPR